jgi:hypothetical protein
MSRVDDDSLSLHLEVALSTTSPALLGGLIDADHHCRHAAASQVARELADRLRCFDIRSDDGARVSASQAYLFPDDLGPIG